MAGGASEYARQYNDDEGEDFAQAVGVDPDEACVVVFVDATTHPALRKIDMLVLRHSRRA